MARSSARAIPLVSLHVEKPSRTFFS